MEHKTILGDVWMYNRCPAPPEPAWKFTNISPPTMPFANPNTHVADTGFDPPESEHDITVQWIGPHDTPTAAIFIYGSLHATLKRGESTR
jgi:hypothetical protein